MVLIALGLVSMTLNRASANRELHELSQATTKSEQIIAALQMHLLEARRVEREVLLWHDADRKHSHRGISAQVVKLADDLEAQLARAAIVPVTLQVQALRQAFRRYSDLFEQSAAEASRLGLDDRSGLRGDLRESMERIHQGLRAAGERELQVQAMETQHRIQDFLLAPMVQPARASRDGVEALQAAVAASSHRMPPAIWREVSEELDRYGRNLSASIDRRMNLSRLAGELSTSFAETETLAKEIRGAVENRLVTVRGRDAESRAAAERLMWISGSGILLACLLMVGLAVGPADRPVIEIARAVEEVAGGNLDIAIGGTQRVDEVGRLARALEGLKRVLKTQRRAYEIAAAEREERYRLLADNTSDIIVLGHDSGRRSYISPAVRDVLGYEPEEALALSLRDLVHPDDIDHVFAATSRLSGSCPQVSVLHRICRRDGSHVWAETVLRRIETEGREGHTTVASVVASVRDVTDRQKQAAELVAAKDLAERANEAKSEFLTTISHEMRTPLNGILGYTDLLLDDPGLQGNHRHGLERIHSAGTALLTVVNDILDFSKIDAGQVELDPQPFSPSALIDDAVAIVKGAADRKGLTLNVTTEGALPELLVGDQDRIRQVLLNLLNNAIKFTPSGEVVLRVECGSRGSSRYGLRFLVTDTGIGIPQAQIGNLFKRFSQVDGSVRRGFGGTGLGLAISKNLIQLMGGAIGVESTEGKGSTFTFSLELAAAKAANPAEQETESPAPAEVPAVILLAEDVVINQEIARAVLEGAGHAVDIVEDGAAAIMAVQQKNYDLVLMDVQMPVVDGMTATRRIRELTGPVRDIPIIAMTANVLPQQVAQFRAVGMNDHVGKPFKREELFAAVRRWAHGPVQGGLRESAA